MALPGARGANCVAEKAVDRVASVKGALYGRGMHGNTRSFEDALALLHAAQEASPGWSDTYGGPAGVALRADAARRELMDIVGDLAVLRRVAVSEMCRDRSLADVASTLGITRAGAHRLHREASVRDHDLNRLLAKGLW